jgi:hypothetical protein
VLDPSLRRRHFSLKSLHVLRDLLKITTTAVYISPVPESLCFPYLLQLVLGCINDLFIYALSIAVSPWTILRRSTSDRKRQASQRERVRQEETFKMVHAVRKEKPHTFSRTPDHASLTKKSLEDAHVATRSHLSSPAHFPSSLSV